MSAMRLTSSQINWLKREYRALKEQYWIAISKKEKLALNDPDWESANRRVNILGAKLESLRQRLNRKQYSPKCMDEVSIRNY